MNRFVRIVLFFALGLLANENMAMVTANDTIVFSLTDATYSNVSGVNYVEIPVRVHSTNVSINAVDWWFQFNQNELTYVSTTSAIGGFDVFSNFNVNNQFLSNSSSTASISNYIPLFTTIMRVKFALSSGCAEIGEDDFYSMTALLNGILSVGKFEGGSVSGDIRIETPLPYCAGSEVFFSFADSVGARPITNYSWGFGDAGTSAAQSVGHVYVDEGTYPVTLQVTNDLGCVYDYNTDVQVNATPTAAFSSVYEPIEDFQTFTNESTIPSGTIVSSDWDFGDGNNSSLTDPKHSYAFDGFYNVTLTVTSDAGCTSSVTQLISNVVDISEAGTDVDIRVFPNPASGEVHVINDYTGYVSMINEVGQRVREDFHTVAGRDYLIDLSGLASGNYFFVSWRNNQPFIERLIVF